MKEQWESKLCKYLVHAKDNHGLSSMLCGSICELLCFHHVWIFCTLASWFFNPLPTSPVDHPYSWTCHYYFSSLAEEARLCPACELGLWPFPCLKCPSSHHHQTYSLPLNGQCRYYFWAFLALKLLGLGISILSWSWVHVCWFWACLSGSETEPDSSLCSQWLVQRELGTEYVPLRAA